MSRLRNRPRRLSILLISLPVMVSLVVFAQQPAKKDLGGNIKTADGEKKTPAAEKPTPKPASAILDVGVDSPGSFHANPSYIRRHSHVSPMVRLKRSPRAKPSEEYRSTLELVNQEREQERLRRARLVAPLRQTNLMAPLRQTNLKPPTVPKPAPDASAQKNK